MIKNIQYIKIHRVLEDVLRHPMLLNVTLELAISYALLFIHAVGCPDLFLNKEVIVDISDFRGVLPCDVVSVSAVKDLKREVCLSNMMDSFNPTCSSNTNSYKVLGRVIITSFLEGSIKVSYKSIPVDDEGFPMIIDDPMFLKALELYIKKEVFTILFDLGKLLSAILLNTLQEYAWKVGLLLSELTIPSLDEMESIKNSWCTLLPRTNEFESGFAFSNTNQRLRVH